MGISFSGGLSIVAAGRPSMRDRVAYVFSLGGHDDLPRVLRYLCTGQEQRPVAKVQLASNTGTPPPFVLPPHDYGVAVILLAIADRAVPAAQVARLREGVRQYLWASALDGGVDKSARARRVRIGCARRCADLPEPSATLLALRHRTRRRPPRRTAAAAARLAGRRSGVVGVAIAEADPRRSFCCTAWATTSCRRSNRSTSPRIARARVRVRLLLSGLISHAEADQPAHAGDVLELAGFWGDLLSR